MAKEWDDAGDGRRGGGAQTLLQLRQRDRGLGDGEGGGCRARTVNERPYLGNEQVQVVGFAVRALPAAVIGILAEGTGPRRTTYNRACRTRRRRGGRGWRPCPGCGGGGVLGKRKEAERPPARCVCVCACACECVSVCVGGISKRPMLPHNAPPPPPAARPTLVKYTPSTNSQPACEHTKCSRCQFRPSALIPSCRTPRQRAHAYTHTCRMGMQEQGAQFPGPPPRQHTAHRYAADRGGAVAVVPQSCVHPHCPPCSAPRASARRGQGKG